MRKSFGKYISMIMRHQRIIIDNAFEKFGFTSGQHGIFIGVAENEGCTQRELGHHLKSTKGTINKGIKKLEEEGFVETRIDEDDRRLHYVYLTDKGRSILPEAYELLANYSKSLSEGLSEEEKEVVFRALIHMAENAEAMVNAIREDNKNED